MLPLSAKVDGTLISRPQSSPHVLVVAVEPDHWKCVYFFHLKFIKLVPRAHSEFLCTATTIASLFALYNCVERRYILVVRVWII